MDTDVETVGWLTPVIMAIAERLFWVWIISHFNLSASFGSYCYLSHTTNSISCTIDTFVTMVIGESPSLLVSPMPTVLLEMIFIV